MEKNFKSFIMRGNIFDMAIGVIIGGAFQKIVNSLVNDIIMPAVSIFTGKVDFNDLGFTVENITIKYGSFITTIINFLIIALSIYIALRVATSVNKRMEQMTEKQLKKLQKKTEKFKKNKKKSKNMDEIKEPETKTCPYCFSEINYKATKCPNCTSEVNYMPITNDSYNELDINK